MTKQYLRKVRLTGSGVNINTEGDGSRDLKIEFDIKRINSSIPNEGTIKVYNLSEASRNAMGKELTELTLEAGYLNGNIGVIFKGHIRDVEHTKEGPTIITTITGGDGDKALRTSTIAKTFKAGTKPEEVMNAVQDALAKNGAEKGEWKIPDNMDPFKRPYTAVGGAKREMDQLGRSFGFYWSVDNGKTMVMPADGTVGGSITIGPDSGMIGPPTIKDTGIKVTVLLNPEIKPGMSMTVQSGVMEMNSEGGQYRIDECEYKGDNRDGYMVVHISASSMEGGKVQEALKNETVENTISPGSAEAGAGAG